MTRPTDAELVKLLRHLAFDVEGDGQPLPIDVRCHVADARATADALAGAADREPTPEQIEAACIADHRRGAWARLTERQREVRREQARAALRAAALRAAGVE